MVLPVATARARKGERTAEQTELPLPSADCPTRVLCPCFAQPASACRSGRGREAGACLRVLHSRPTCSQVSRQQPQFRPARASAEIRPDASETAACGPVPNISINNNNICSKNKMCKNKMCMVRAFEGASLGEPRLAMTAVAAPFER